MLKHGRFRFPDDTKRTVVIGKTGTGKTQFGAWLLSNLSIETMPWIVIDYKREKLFAEIPHTTMMGLHDPIPDKPGLYIVQPTPELDDDDIASMLWAVLHRENCGIFIDEGYMIPNGPAIRSVLTQGRSKHIPMVILTQRPKWISRFVMSEADFFSIFWLNDLEDRKTVNRYIPEGVYERLPDFYSLWYDVGADSIVRLEPVPDSRAIVDRFAKRLAPKQAGPVATQNEGEKKRSPFRFL